MKYVTFNCVPRTSITKIKIEVRFKALETGKKTSSGRRTEISVTWVTSTDVEEENWYIRLEKGKKKNRPKWRRRDNKSTRQGSIEANFEESLDRSRGRDRSIKRDFAPREQPSADRFERDFDTSRSRSSATIVVDDDYHHPLFSFSRSCVNRVVVHATLTLTVPRTRFPNPLPAGQLASNCSGKCNVHGR